MLNLDRYFPAGIVQTDLRISGNSDNLLKISLHRTRLKHLNRTLVENS